MDLGSSLLNSRLYDVVQECSKDTVPQTRRKKRTMLLRSTCLGCPKYVPHSLAECPFENKKVGQTSTESERVPRAGGSERHEHGPKISSREKIDLISDDDFKPIYFKDFAKIFSRYEMLKNRVLGLDYPIPTSVQLNPDEQVLLDRLLMKPIFSKFRERGLRPGGSIKSLMDLVDKIPWIKACVSKDPDLRKF